MKIGIDIRSLMEPRYFGVGEYTFHLLDNIFKIDRENQYFLFYNSFKEVKENLPKWDYPNVKFVGFHWPNKIFNLCQKCLGLPKVDKLIGGVDIFFMPNLHFISLSKNCRKVITIHDLSFERYPEFFSWKRRLWHKFINPKKLLKQFDQIVSDSQNTKDDLVSLYKIAPQKIRAIYLGIPTSERQHLEYPKELLVKSVKGKYNLPDRFIFYLGTLEPRKNIKTLIAAFDKLVCDLDKEPEASKIKLVIAGVKGWLYKSIYKTAQKAKNRERIKFIGYVEPEDKSGLYQLASVFVYPSFYEGFGFPVLEAMRSQCPVVTSLNSSLPEIAGEAALLIDPYKIDDLKEAMKQILADKELREDLIEKGNKQVEKFDWRKTAKEILDCL